MFTLQLLPKSVLRCARVSPTRFGAAWIAASTLALAMAAPPAVWVAAKLVASPNAAENVLFGDGFEGFPNSPPTVSAGPAQTIVAAAGTGVAETDLAGSASDDGLPAGRTLSVQWSVLSAPNAPALLGFDPGGVGGTTPGAQLLTPHLKFGKPGVYVLRLDVDDSQFSAHSEVTITVNAAANLAPVLSPPGNRSIKLGTALDLLLAASDPNSGDSLTYTLIAGPPGAVLDPAGSNRLRYTPAAVGGYPLTVRVQDQLGANDQKNFTLTVTPANRAPLFAPLSDGRIPAGAPFASTLVATDADGDALTYELLSGPPGMSLNGSALSWTPTATQLGVAYVKVRVKDSSQAASDAIFQLDVFTNAVPVAHDDAYSVRIGQTLTVPAAYGVLSNDNDPDAQALSANKLSNPALGNLTAFNPDGSFTYVAPAVPPPPALAMKIKRYIHDASNFNLSTQALVADMNGTGTPDTLGVELNNNLRVYAGGTGVRRNEWVVPSDCGYYFLANSEQSVAVGDVDDAPGHSVEYVAPCDPARMVAFGPNGVPRWVSPSVYVGGNPSDYGNASPMIERAPTLARLTPNGGVKVFVPLVVQADMGGPGHMGCRLLTGDPAHEARACHAVIQIDGATGAIERYLIALWPLDAGALYQDINVYRRAFLSVVVADIDGDGIVEIASGPAVWNNDGSLRWSKAINPADTGVADLDGDGKAEVVMLGSEAGLSVSMKRIYAFNADGSARFSLPLFPVNLGNEANSRLTIADIDGDSRPEILFAVYTQLWAIDGFGRVRWIRGFDPDPLTNSLFDRGQRAAVFDLDNDGQPEVVVKNSDQVLVLRGKDGVTLAKFSTLPPPPNDGYPEQSPYSVGGDAPVIADVDGDGHADIVLDLKNRPDSGGVLILTGANDDWAPAPKIWNQPSYRPSTVDDTGHILFDPGVPTSYVQQKRLATPDDTRAPNTTRFTYAAGDGVASSAPATVTLTLLPQNRPPTITSPTPPTASATFGGFDYAFAASDPDAGDVLTWSIAHDGCPTSSIDPATGQFHSGYLYGTPCTFAVRVTDSQGASAVQVFPVTFTSATSIVPDLAGLDEAQALVALQDAGLVLGDAQRIYNGAAADSIIAQVPVAQSVVPFGTSVTLTVSRGPQPVVVPNVVGTVLPLAQARLAAVGLAESITRVLSNTVPAEQVIAQSTAPGSSLVPTPANPVALTVSAGNGLSLYLDRAAVLAGQSIAVSAVARNADGSAAALPALTYSLTPRVLPQLGPPPAYASNTITTAAGTLGSFLLNATDAATGRSAKAEFAVIAPADQGEDSATALYAHLAEVLDGIEAIGRQLRVAQAANDVPQMTALTTDLVQLWRTVDPSDLRLAPPVVLPQGFPPTLVQMAGFGVTPGPDDALMKQVMTDAADDLDAWTQDLIAPNTSLAQLKLDADRFSLRAARINALGVSEYGTVANAAQITLLLGHRIPAFYEALTNELAPVVGLPRRAADFPGAGPQAEKPSPIGKSLIGAANGSRAKSTLAELAVTEAVGYITDKIMEKGSETFKNAKQFAHDIYGQAGYSAAALAATQHLRQFVQGLDLYEVVSGASLSFRVFGPPAFIEVPGNVESPDLNAVMIIGKTNLENGGGSIQALVDAIKESYSYGVDAASNVRRCKNGNECFSKVKKLIDGMQEKLTDPAQNVVRAAQGFYQTPTSVELGCVFALDPGCVQLMYRNGIASVYEYAPPEGYGSFTGLPTPVIVIVQDEVSGLMYFATPVFFPSLPP